MALILGTRHLIPFLWLSIAVLSDAYASTAACDTSLSPSQGGTGYGARDGRCEGMYVSPVSGEEIGIVSVTHGRIAYELSPGARVRVSIRDTVLPVVKSPIRVRARGRYSGTYYRMDALLDDALQVDWPVDDVLRPEGLSSELLGVLCWYESPGLGRVFVPACVSCEESAQAAVICVSTSSAFAELYWRYYADGVLPNEYRRAATHVLPGDVVEVTVPPGPQALLVVEFEGRLVNDAGWRTGLFYVLR